MNSKILRRKTVTHSSTVSQNNTEHRIHNREHSTLQVKQFVFLCYASVRSTLAVWCWNGKQLEGARGSKLIIARQILLLFKKMGKPFLVFIGYQYLLRGEKIQSWQFERLFKTNRVSAKGSWKLTYSINSLGVDQWRTEGAGVQPPPPPKFRSFDKAEPNSQFRGIYIRNNIIRIRVSFICKMSGTPD
jgi:hypothetical protein